ncbi:hypothetical protein L209DRAFT_689165, partial [Thermothelomyces heterothallicus CBS 203.75]
SFSIIKLNTREPIFSYSQFYIIISRAINIYNISIYLLGYEERYKKLINIIYPKVLIR